MGRFNLAILFKGYNTWEFTHLVINRVFSSKTLDPYKSPPEDVGCAHFIRLPGDTCLKCVRSRAALLSKMKPMVQYIMQMYEELGGVSVGLSVALKFSGEMTPHWFGIEVSADL